MPTPYIGTDIRGDVPTIPVPGLRRLDERR